MCAGTLEAEIKREIFLEPFEATMLKRAYGFHNAVTVPSKTFVEYWGGEDFVALVLQSMMNGELDELKRFFSNRIGVENAWEKLFMRPGFSLHTERSN